MVKVESDSDGWIRGSSESIYAVKPSTQSTPPPAKAPGKSHATPSRASGSAGASKSLLDRMDATPPPKAKPNTEQRETEAQSTTPLQTSPTTGFSRPGAKVPSPLPLSSPARNAAPSSPSGTRTPLSASHPVPETPLKLSQRKGPQTPATPHYPHYPNTSRGQNDGESPPPSGLGLGLTPLKKSVPLTPASDSRGPLNEPLYLRGRAGSNASPTGRSSGSPLKSGITDLNQSQALGADSSASAASASGEADRPRPTKSSLGTSASMWAPKPATSNGTSAASATTSHTIGSGFSSSNLREPQTGPDRKRPTHRPSGLQLSLGQEIRVMQGVDEGTEDDLPPSNKSSAPAVETFQIERPADETKENQHGWYGNVVPPTPALGCDSPVSSEDGYGKSNGNAKGKDAFGWGSARSNSLFSNLHSSSSRLEANWSGDDDDEHRDDEQVFQDMHRAAKASSKTRAAANSSSFSPLPPPPLQYKSRTPSPTHRLLAVSPQLDTDNRPNRPASPSGSAMGMAMQDAVSSRGSPASARSGLPSDDEDGDADVENDKPKRTRKTKKPDAASPVDAKRASPPAEKDSAGAGETGSSPELKKALKRDKSERIRGRRQSQSKDKDVAVSGAARAGEEPADLVDQVADISLDRNADSTSPAPPKPVSAADDAPPTVATPPAQPTEEKALVTSPPSQDIVLGTPQSSTSAFDWAADDDDMDDTLPDLDDWGVTISPSIPAPLAAAQTRKPSGSKPDDGAGAWRAVGQSKQGSKKDAPSKGKAHGADSKTQGKASGKKGEAAGGLGARIAGRAQAAVPPEPVHTAPPASTPYGSWNKVPAASTPQPAADKSTFKGSGQRKAPNSGPPSAATSPKESRDGFAPHGKARKGEHKDAKQPASGARPRIAADLGALAKLMSPSEPSKPSGDKKQDAKDGAGKKEARKSGAEAHVPSVADSMHAPKPATDAPAGAKRGAKKSSGSRGAK